MMDWLTHTPVPVIELEAQMTESVGNAWKFAGRGGRVGGAEMTCRLLGLKIGVANMQKTL